MQTRLQASFGGDHTFGCKQYCKQGSEQHVANHKQWGNVCPARYFSINYPDFSPRFTLSWRSPPNRPHYTAHLPYKARCIVKQDLRIQPLQLSFAICNVLNKQHWSHKCGCQYIHYNSAPYTHHKLRRWSAVGNTTHTLLPHPLPHLAWRPSCFGQSKPEAGHAPMVRTGGDGLASGCKTV